jgi:hypothetical protein
VHLSSHSWFWRKVFRKIKSTDYRNEKIELSLIHCYYFKPKPIKLNHLEKGELWKQSFLYIEPKFWRSVDYCDLPGAGEASFATIVDYFNDESD